MTALGMLFTNCSYSVTSFDGPARTTKFLMIPFSYNIALLCPCYQSASEISIQCN